MLAEALTALAAASGTAVVQAAGTDVWAEVRQRVARLFGHGDIERERAELERLDQTAATLEATANDEVERVRVRQEASWQTRFELLLESLDELEQERVAAELRALAEEQAEQAKAGGGVVSHNEFHGPTAFQVGSHSEQTNHFGSSA
ncbi:hypothetical protein ACFUKV_33185 [Streptomyces paradoxus]|uniref:hypothetical protein n=1 Tax=Streptomyces paradoxus TaxID=66375 RepID=UPI003634B76E